MFKRLSQFIADEKDFFAVLFILLIAIIIILLIRSYVQRKKILKLSPNKPGTILNLEDGDHIVVSPLATVFPCDTPEKGLRIYELLFLGGFCKPTDVGKLLNSFYTHPFEITLKISDLEKELDGSYSIIVSDKNNKKYKLKTKYLPENYTVKIHGNFTENSDSELSE